MYIVHSGHIHGIVTFLAWGNNIQYSPPYKTCPRVFFLKTELKKKTLRNKLRLAQKKLFRVHT